jgi:hypothetical protein
MQRFQALIVDLEEVGDGTRSIIRRRTLPGRLATIEKKSPSGDP